MLKTSSFLLILITTIVCLGIPLHAEEFLGEYVRGQDTITVSGKLMIISDGEEIPLRDEEVYLYLCTNGTFDPSTARLLDKDITGADGSYSFSIFVDESFPLGEILLVVYYPGSISKGLSSAYIYYRAKIISPEISEGEERRQTEKAILIIILLIIMMATSAVISIKSALKRARSEASTPMWKEILGEMIERAKRRDINFVLLVGELIDSLCRKLGIIPKVSATLLEKAMMLSDVLDEKAFNVLQNIVDIYELLSYGGPYARTVLISTFDFEVWKVLLDQLMKSIQEKVG